MSVQAAYDAAAPRSNFTNGYVDTYQRFFDDPENFVPYDETLRNDEDYRQGCVQANRDIKRGHYDWNPALTWEVHRP
jgi:hypothetical protein